MKEFSGDDFTIDQTDVWKMANMKFNSNFTTFSEDTLKKSFEDFNKRYQVYLKERIAPQFDSKD